MGGEIRERIGRTFVTKVLYLVVLIDQAKCYNTYIKCALDFPGKNANLRLALLHGFGGGAMLTSCTLYVTNPNLSIYVGRLHGFILS